MSLLITALTGLEPYKENCDFSCNISTLSAFVPLIRTRGDLNPPALCESVMWKTQLSCDLAAPAVHTVHLLTCVYLLS